MTTFTERLTKAFECFAGADGSIRVDIRSFQGYHHEQGVINIGEPPPFWLLDRLKDGMSVRVAPFTTAGVTPFLFCLWRPAVEFHRRLEVTTEAITAIVDALRTMPKPALFVSSGPELWAAWRLPTAVSVDDIRPQLEALNRRLAADATILTDPLAITLPLCGPVRNWNTADLEFAEILEVNPESRIPFPSPTCDSLTTQEPSDEQPNRRTAGRARGHHRTHRQRAATT